MTYSIGFRAPSRSELIAEWSDHLLGALPDDDRYADPHLRTQDNPGEITPAAIAQLHAMMTETMGDQAAFARWFGTYNSTGKYPDADWRPEAPIAVAQLRAELATDVPLCRNPASRFSFIREGADALSLFVDGQYFACGQETIALAEHLCTHDPVRVDAPLRESDAAMTLLASLYNQGSVAFDREA